MEEKRFMPDVIVQVGAYRTTVVGTELVRPSTKEDWRNYGEVLRRVDEAKQWAIGDWLVDGKRHYGDKVYEEAAKILEAEKNTLEHYKSQSERFEFCTRVQNLSSAHHREVSSIKKIVTNKNGKLELSSESDMEAIAKLLEKAEQENLSVRELRELVATYKRRQQEEIRLANEPEKYSVILADPAWEYEFSRSDNRQIENQYLPSSLEDMKRLKLPAADNCVLFMWGTSPKMEEALALISAWGFTYKTMSVWVKDQIGMGYYFRQKHELLLVATKGNLQLPDENKRPESVFYAPRTEHSEKPDIAYEIIEKMYPDFKKLEMFAREEREGWDSWGDQV